MNWKANIVLVRSELFLEYRPPANGSYLTEGNDRKIRENESQMDDVQREIGVATDATRTIESAIRSLEVESSSASTLKNNIEANLRYRSEQKKVEKVQEELDGIDLAQAARMRREFNIKYKGMLEEEQRVQSAVSQLLPLIWHDSHKTVESSQRRACADDQE
jgi:DNA repair protein RAD50